MSTAPPTLPAPCRSANRPTRCATASPACSRAISRLPPPSSPRARAEVSSTALPVGRCGKRGSIMRTGPGTASAASSRSMKGRSGGAGSSLRLREGRHRRRPVGSRQSGGDEPLQAGMIISNEPGYYKTGEYGIRIENLVLVCERQIEGAEKEMLGFETLTFAPIDRRLINAQMLEPEELIWLNCYHAHVLVKIGPQLNGDDLAWLQAACAPIEI